MTHRKTLSAVSFIDGKRVYEQETINKRNRFPATTFVYL
jgi:hypothetical protein